MNKERPKPPALAVWLLRTLLPKQNREVLTGDLLERFGEGQQPEAWLWRQVLTAIIAGISAELRNHWPQICFALAGTTVAWFLANRTMRLPAVERLWVWSVGLPWPLASAYDFGFHAAVRALMVQPLLAILLLLDRTFSWPKMLRTLLISLMLLATSGVIAFLWMTYPPVTWPPPRLTQFCLGALMPFFAFLISAWVGSRSLAPADDLRCRRTQELG